MLSEPVERTAGDVGYVWPLKFGELPGDDRYPLAYFCFLDCDLEKICFLLFGFDKDGSQIFARDQAGKGRKTRTATNICEPRSLGQKLHHRQRFEHMTNGELFRGRRPGEMKQRIMFHNQIEMIGKPIYDGIAKIDGER